MLVKVNALVFKLIWSHSNNVGHIKTKWGSKLIMLPLAYNVSVLLVVAFSPVLVIYIIKRCGVKKLL